MLTSPFPDLAHGHALRRLARAAVAVLSLTFVGGTALTAQPTATAQAAELQLRPGDAVKLSVWRAPEFDGEFPVLPNGTIAHPFLRDIVVVGLPLAQVRDALERRARTQNENAQVVVQPLLRVVVGGEVRTPNLYRHPAGTTVAEALILAGGPSERANLRRAALVRDGQTTYFDLSDPTGLATRTAVASGDQLLLSRRRALREAVLPVVSMLGTAASIATLIRYRR